MARKDVDLVIRAKDEAGKVVDSITKALNEFIGAQTDLAAKAGKTDTALTALGGAIGRLDKELKGLDVRGAIGAELDKAAASSARLGKAFQETQERAAKLAVDLKKAEFATDRLTAKANGAAAAQAKQAEALARAQTSQNALNKSLTEAVNKRDKLVAAEERLAAAIAKQQAKVNEAAERYQKLAAAVAQVETPSRTLQKRLDSSNASLEKQTAKLNELQGTFAKTQGDITKTASAIEKLEQSVEKSNASVAKQEQVLSKISENYRNLQATSKAAAGNQREIGKAANDTANSLAKQDAQIERARVELGQLAAAAGKAGTAMRELADKSGAAMVESFNRQRRAMLEARREWFGMTEETSRLAAAISKVGVPTQAMAEAFTRSKAAAAQAKQEYLAQRNGLQQLSGVLRQAGGDLDSLRAKQAAFASAQAQTGIALARIRSEAQQAAGSYNLLSGNANRGAVAIRQVGTAAATAAANTQRAARSTDSLAVAYRKLYGESRLAMSWTQRLGGEVLALVTAYGGLYGVISLLNRTVDAYQKLEAAQARLGVVFNQDQARTAEELDFLRRNADRLGISLSLLSDEYSKFAVAADAANFTAGNTRKIFVAVAEAARVNKNSSEQMSGVFLALQQMISKGKITSEELRRQLGDRMAGAFNIFADALGLTTAQLDEMMQAGEVLASETNLVKFADELTERFGPQLGLALESTTTELGKFENAAFQALIVFGNGGFIESFTNLLKSLTATMKSADFIAFSQNVSAGFGLLADAIALAVRNFEAVVFAASLFAGIKLGPIVVALAGKFAGLVTTVQRLGTIFLATQTTMATASAGMTGLAANTTRAGVAMRGLTLAVRTLVSSTGIGLIVTLVAIGIGQWATSADDATEAMVRHQSIVDRVKNAYDKAGDSAERLYDELEKVTVLELENNVRDLGIALDGIRAKAKPVRDLFGGMPGAGQRASSGAVGVVNDMVKAFRDGRLSATEFATSLDLVAANNPELRDTAAALIKVSNEAAEMEAKIAEAAASLAAKTGTLNDTQRALLGLQTSLEAAGDEASANAAKTKEYEDAMAALRDVIPEIGANLDDMKKRADLDEAFESAKRAAQTMRDLNDATNVYTESLNRLYQGQADRDFGKFTNGVEASAALIRQKEGFISTPKADMTIRRGQEVNSGLRVGFGSDTITLSDGTIQRVTAGMRVSVADANRDLIRRIGEFQQGIKRDIGSERFAGFTPQQQAALTSVAYNYGSLPERIIKAVKTGTDQEIAAAIRGLGGDNGGINRDRRGVEAALFTTTANVEGLAAQERADAEKLADEAARRAEEAARFHEQQAASIEQAQFELSIQDQELIKREQLKAIREAEVRAQEAGTVLSDKERQQIEQTIAAKYEQQAIDEQKAATAERAAAADQRVNELLTQRTELERQLAIYKEEGANPEVLAATEEQMAQINLQLQEAIANAIAMWEAVGGGAADAAIAKLRTASLEAAKFGQQARTNLIDWQRVGNLFADGLVNAFDNFAKAVAEGKSVGEAAREAFLQFASDFLRQIAQMILKQAILNALRAFFPGFGGVGAGHTGGLVGSSRVGSGNQTRNVSSAVFAGAMRYHTGGVAGLRPNEVPIIAKKGEEIITEEDPRHMFNGGLGGGGGAAPVVNLKNINMFDAAGVLEEALNTRVGEEALLNVVRNNSGAFKQAIG